MAEGREGNAGADDELDDDILLEIVSIGGSGWTTVEEDDSDGPGPI